MPQISRRRFLNGSLAAGMTAAAVSSPRSNGLLADPPDSADAPVRRTTREGRSPAEWRTSKDSQTGVEVVPAAITGSHEIMRKGSWKIRTGRTIHVHFGEPVSVEGLDMEDRAELTERVRGTVGALLEANNR